MSYSIMFYSDQAQKIFPYENDHYDSMNMRVYCSEVFFLGFLYFIIVPFPWRGSAALISGY